MAAVRLIYIAGRFSAPNREGVEANIRAAELVGLEVAKLGGYPLIPHSNTSHPEFEAVQPYDFWIDATKAMLCTCEALILVEGWEQSSGARGEKLLAEERGMPVFMPGDYEGLEWWLRMQSRDLRGVADTLPPPRSEQPTLVEDDRAVLLGAGTVSAPDHEVPT